MRRARLAVLLIALVPAPAEAGCHHYSRWFYPFPQRCPEADRSSRPNFARITPPIRPPPDVEFPLPDLDVMWTPCPEADEATRAHVLLKAKLAGE